MCEHERECECVCVRVYFRWPTCIKMVCEGFSFPPLFVLPCSFCFLDDVGIRPHDARRHTCHSIALAAATHRAHSWSAQGDNAAAANDTELDRSQGAEAVSVSRFVDKMIWMWRVMRVCNYENICLCRRRQPCKEWIGKMNATQCVRADSVWVVLL